MGVKLPYLNDMYPDAPKPLCGKRRVIRPYTAIGPTIPTHVIRVIKVYDRSRRGSRLRWRASCTIKTVDATLLFLASTHLLSIPWPMLQIDYREMSFGEEETGCFRES